MSRFTTGKLAYLDLRIGFAGIYPGGDFAGIPRHCPFTDFDLLWESTLLDKCVYGASGQASEIFY